MSNKLYLGNSLDTGNLVYITDEQRSTHMQVIGSTGTGKSKFLQHLITEDITAENGLCLIDPHGYLYDEIIQLLDGIKFPKEKIILIDPSETDYVPAFDPLRPIGKDLSYQVDAMVNACAKVWGGEDTDKTPLLKRCLRITFHALAEAGLSLLEAQYLISPTQKSVREYVAEKVKDPIIREQWEYFNTLTAKNFYEEFGSTINRLMEFLAAERLRNIIGQKIRALNFRKIMDEGYVVLVNLSSGKRVSRDNARLLGTLIVNDLFLTATERPKGSDPFYLYIDECSLFINEDVGRILDEGRKFGLHLILAHQHLAQLQEAGEKVYKSVMTSARTKIVFGGLTPEDAKILAEMMFLDEIDLGKVKHTLDAPAVIGYTTTWLKNFSHAESQAEMKARTAGTSKSKAVTESEGFGSGSVSGISASSTYMGAGMMETMPFTLTQGEMSSSSSSRMEMRGYSEAESEMEATTRATSRGTSDSEGVSQAIVPVYKTMPRATYTLEELIFECMRTLVSQPTRHAIVKLPGILSKRVEVPFVAESPQADEESTQIFKNEINRLSEIIQTLPEAKKEIEYRQVKLLEDAKKFHVAKKEAERAAKEADEEYKRKKVAKKKEEPKPEEETHSRKKRPEKP